MRYYDWLGRRVVDGRVEGAILEAQKHSFGGRLAVLKTDAGDIPVWTCIERFGALNLMVETGDDAPATRVREVPFRANQRSFSYRWGLLHLLSLAFLVDIFATTFQTRAWYQTNYEMRLMATIFLVPALLCAHLYGWNTRVVITALGIEWRDFLGQVHVKATFDQIVSVREIGAGEDAKPIEIVTTEGTIRASCLISGRKVLLAELQRVLSTRGGDRAAEYASVSAAEQVQAVGASTTGTSEAHEFDRTGRLSTVRSSTARLVPTLSTASRPAKTPGRDAPIDDELLAPREG